MKSIARPTTAEAYQYAQGYIDQVPGEALHKGMEQIHNQSWKVLGNLKVDADFRYAPEKWSIKELVQHIVDTERILCYRALCFARGENVSLPGFEENDYAKNSNADQREFHSIMREFDIVRIATRELFNSFSDDMLLNQGTASGNTISVRALGWFIAGHEQHHVNVLQERYL